MERATNILNAPTSLDVFISAPNGCSDARLLLDILEKINWPGLNIIILEYGSNCLISSKDIVTENGILHRHFQEFSEFEMRKIAFESSQAKWLLFLEDHALPDSNFFINLKHALSHELAIDAMTFYGKNGTPNSVGSRAVYNWVWGKSEEKIFPIKPEPVCSVFLVRKDSAMKEIERNQGFLRKGELEMQIIPRLVNKTGNTLSYQMTIIHFEDVKLPIALLAVASNARITGHLETFFLPKRGWIKHMFRRYFSRISRIRRAKPFTLIDIVSLYLMAIACFFGVITGRYFGIGDSERNLAKAHPEITS